MARSGSVRFRVQFRPVPELHGSIRFGSVRPVRFGFLFLPAFAEMASRWGELLVLPGLLNRDMACSTTPSPHSAPLPSHSLILPLSPPPSMLLWTPFRTQSMKAASRFSQLCPTQSPWRDETGDEDDFWASEHRMALEPGSWSPFCYVVFMFVVCLSSSRKILHGLFCCIIRLMFIVAYLQVWRFGGSTRTVSLPRR